MSVADIDAALSEIKRSTGPVVAGPWMSEIGFELLYWIPFLRWCIGHGILDPARLSIVSRGGCRSWYSGMGDYQETYAHFSPDKFRALNTRRIVEQAPEAKQFGMRRGQLSAKHFMCGAADREILAAMQLEKATAFHPLLMYRLFQSYWRKYEPLLHRNRTKVKPITPPAPPAGLPKKYIAVKFYASQCCPAITGNRLMVNQIIRHLVAHDGLEVVLLHTGTAYDDHGEFPIDHHPRVHHRTFTPDTNLDEQTAILGGARGFVCTYGGFAYLGPFLGVPTMALFGVENFRRDHLSLMQHVASMKLKVPFRVLPLATGICSVRNMLTKQLRHVA